MVKFDDAENHNSQFNKKEKKGSLPLLSKEELHNFIEKHRNTKENVRVNLGKITAEAAERIKKVTGLDVKRIILDSDSIRHVFDKKEHNLLPNDLDDMVEIINTAKDVALSSVKNKQGNPVIKFTKNEISILEEYRSGKKELELQTAYRPKNVQQPHDAESQPQQTSKT